MRHTVCQNPCLRSTTMLVSTLLLLFATGARAQQTEGPTDAGFAETSTPGAGIYNRMPQRPVGLPDIDTAKERFYVPVDPSFVPSQLPPSDAPLEGFDNNSEGEEGLGKSASPAADGDYVAYLNSNLTVSDGGNGVLVIDEPSVAVNGRVVFYTGNTFAAFSGDGGANFQYVDPFDNFPADGSTDFPANSGLFCCDQVAHFEPTRGLLVWFLQYRKSGENPAVNSNRFRIAIANSQEDVLNNNWFSWTISPASYGLPATGVWFDYPDLSFTDEFLYITTNVFNIVAVTPTTPQGRDTYNTSLLIRYPLDDIADAGGLSGHYWNRNTGTLRPVQNATTRMYAATHLDNNTIRIYHVTDNSVTLNVEDVDHAGYNRLVGGLTPADVMNAPGPDGTNFAGRSDSRILGAWRSAASSEIGFMWNADESDGNGDVSAIYTFPYTRIVRIKTSDFSVTQQRSIYHGSFAWMYPSVNVNARGHLGGTISSGGGTRNPTSYSWLVDDYSSPAFPSLSGLEVHAFASGNDGPNANTWGDYLTTRRMVPYGNTWVGTGFRLTGGGNDVDTVPEFLWFGRERDMPPSPNTIYVNHTNSTGHEDGTLAHPFSTADEGEVALQPGDHLRISTGTYNESVVFDTQSDVNNRGGTAIIVAGGPEANAEARLKASEDDQPDVEAAAAPDQEEESGTEEPGTEDEER